jgi:hypothetical protein
MWCPSCNIELQSQVITCANCKADFSNPSGWKPLSIQPTGEVKIFTQKKIRPQEYHPESITSKLIGRLVIGFVVFMGLFAMWVLLMISTGGGWH